jgi:hypothetical protein
MKASEIEVGNRFGNWTVIEEGERNHRSRPRFWCHCACGSDRLVLAESLVKGTSKSCGCSSATRPRQKLVIGAIFDKWTIIAEAENVRGPTQYLCRCACGTERIVPANSLKMGVSTSCGCNRFKFGPNSHNWLGYGELSADYWGAINRGAENRGKQVKTSIEYAWDLFLKQDRKCALSGEELCFGKDKTASLDRIDSDIDYIEGNVQWIHKDINKMKNNLSEEVFIEWCKKIADHARSKEEPLTYQLAA